MYEGKTLEYAAERVGMSRAALNRAVKAKGRIQQGDLVTLGGDRRYYVEKITEGGCHLSSEDGRINGVIFGAEHCVKVEDDKNH